MQTFWQIFGYPLHLNTLENDKPFFDKNKPKSERFLVQFTWKLSAVLVVTLFENVYCLMQTLKNSVLFDSNSQKMLLLFDKGSVLFVSSGLYELWKICIVG